MKKISLLLILISNFLFASFSYAQTNQTKRLEFDMSDVNNVSLTAFKNSKSFLVKSHDKEEDTPIEHKYDYTIYDENFKKTFSKVMMVNEDNVHLDKLVENDTYYEFFYSKRTKALIIYKFDIAAKKVETKEIPCDKSFRKYLTNLVILNGKIYFYYQGDKSIELGNIDYKAGKISTTEIMPEEKGVTFQDLQICKGANGEQEIITKFYRKEARKNYTILMFVFDKDGKLKSKSGLSLPHIDEETQRRETTLSKLDDGTYIVVGTYTKDRSNKTNGIYISKMKNNGELMFDKAFNYLDLPKFTDYLSERQQGKIERKKENKEKNGKELNIDYYSTIHDVFEKNGKYYMICEFYYPTYRTETYYNGKTYSSRQVFDGYYYTHGLIAAIDDKGKMLWSNIFDMSPSYKPYIVKHFIIANTNGANINLLMESGNNILSKSFSETGTLLSDEKSDQIETMKEDDKSIKTYENNVTYWYDKNFICYGSQKIKSEDKEKRKRKVVFINKISVK